MKEKRPVWIHVRGDRSVGEQDKSIWIDFPDIDYFDDDCKEFVGEQLTECFENIYDCQVDVFMSEDEVYTGTVQ